MAKFITSLLIDLFVLLLVIGVVLMSLAGVLVPRQYPTLSEGPYQLAAFDTNISFYQHGRNSNFFSLSPFNDFIITNDNIRIPMLSVQAYQDKTFTTFPKLSNWKKSVTFLQSFFQTPTIYFKLQSIHAIEYTAQLQENQFVINRTFLPASGTTVVATGSTLQFSDEDVVFNPITRELYSTPSDETIINFAKVYGIALNKLQPLNPGTDEKWLVQQDKIAIASPDMAGFLTVNAKDDQQLYVSPFNHLIESVEPAKSVQNGIKTTMNITVTNNVEDIR